MVRKGLNLPFPMVAAMTAFGASSSSGRVSVNDRSVHRQRPSAAARRRAGTGGSSLLGGRRHGCCRLRGSGFRVSCTATPTPQAVPAVSRTSQASILTHARLFPTAGGSSRSRGWRRTDADRATAAGRTPQPTLGPRQTPSRPTRCEIAEREMPVPGPHASSAV
jgi:hypothetical protein